MKIFILILLINGLDTFPALASTEGDIIGRWGYDGFVYEGHRYPNPNPDLELTFTFDEAGQRRLFWRRKNESVSCENLATFELDGDRLIQKVFWVNPKNAFECSSDSDMQLGKETVTVISISQAELTFHFDLNGKPFLYLLKHIKEY